MRRSFQYLLLALLFLARNTGFHLSNAAPPACPTARYIIFLLGDGMGENHRLAANAYLGQTPAYQQTWDKYWVSTYPAGGSYLPASAWSDFGYVRRGYTDSAAAATALFTGTKTNNIRISVSEDGSTRLTSIADLARNSGKAIGAVTSVYISHATPGGWLAHNFERDNGYAIADESLWGNPNTTGTPASHSAYSGGFGNSLPPADVLIGAGHPDWGGSYYVNSTMLAKLRAENGNPGAFRFIERESGSIGGACLLALASDPSITRISGLFGGAGGNLEYRLADGSGFNSENPTLAQMAESALEVLNRDPGGFVLLIEGGAIDWGAHNNNMDQMLGEALDFYDAVQVVIEWVDNPTTDSTWENTLVIVTADHETGYLTRSPGVFPDQPLGEISEATIALEKGVVGGYRASWQDANSNNLIDAGETVHWAWNWSNHTNSLVPLYVKGAGSSMFSTYALQTDHKRGAYLDNTDVFKVMQYAGFTAPCPKDNFAYLPVIARIP